MDTKQKITELLQAELPKLHKIVFGEDVREKASELAEKIMTFLPQEKPQSPQQPPKRPN